MNKKVILDKKLKEELDSYLFKYSTKNPETIYKALEILEYARDILTDIDCPENIGFEILQANTDGDYKKIEELKKEKELREFFKILDYFIDAVNSASPEVQRIPEKQKNLYLADIKTF